MPYIAQHKRNVLDPMIESVHRSLVELHTDDPDDNMEGNLNYVLTRLLHMVYGQRDSTRYSNINDAMGVMLCAALEYYRTVGSPYEDQKRHDNGDIVQFRSEPTVVPETIVQELEGE